MQPQTQGKLFIAIGTVGLLAALYFLVTAFFPGDNTQKNTQTGTMEQSGATAQNNEVDFNELLLAAQSGLDVHVLIPEFLFTSGFEDIAEDIRSTLSIQTKFFTPDSLNVYKDMDENWLYSGQNIDIMLVPVDYMYKFIEQSKTLPIAETIAPYYNTEFKTITDREDYTFVPHAIDPAVIFSQTNKIPPTSINDRLDMVTNWTAPKRYHVPLAFGIGTQDRAFLKQGRESFSDNFFFFYQIIKYIIQGEDSVQSIKTLIDIANIIETNAWNISDFVTITNKLAERNKHCKIYPNICMFNYNFADHRFGFLSDIAKIQKYFSLQDYIISPFWYNTTHPARGRGFLIHDTDKKSTNIAHFLEGYIQASLIDINPTLWSNTIPASNAANATIKNSQIPAELANTANRSILIGDGETAKIFTQETAILDVIGGQYNPELFIENTNRQF